MGKTLFVAIVAAILASVATTILLSSFESPDERATMAQLEKHQDQIETLREVIDTLERRQTTKRRQSKRAQETERGGQGQDGPDSPAGGLPTAGAAEGEAPVAPDGTPYVSRADLESYFAEQAESLRPKQTEFAEVEPVEAKTLEEVAAEMGLSLGEEAQVRIILRESEEEKLQILFGDMSIEEIKIEVAEAADDPDKQAAMIQNIMPRVFTNLGTIVTMESRQKKKLESVLGKERTAEFLGREVKSIHGDQFQDIFDGL